SRIHTFQACSFSLSDTSPNFVLLHSIRIHYCNRITNKPNHLGLNSQALKKPDHFVQALS
ncbi:hypothetical protein, partial [Xenorhabdus griffiniae]|uniref:hypothetical protein n=1 Tax=Xenorhabdus griffiniae TaxID=351672 RepID=UPI001CB88D8D